MADPSAKLVPEASFGPAAASAPEPDTDANDAVNATLADLGVDRAAIEGSSDVILPDEPESDAAAGDKTPAAADGKKAPKPAKAAAATPDTKDGKGKDAAAAASTPATAAGEDLDLNLTNEDLAEIEKNPIMKRAYKTMLRGLNKAQQSLAEQRKANESDLGIIATLRKDPTAGLRALAATMGVPVTIGDGTAAQPAASTAAAAQAPKTPQQIAEEELLKAFPKEGAAVLGPIFTRIAEAIATEQLKPVLAKLAEGERILMGQRQVTMQSQLNSQLATYGRSVEARGDDWTDEIQVEMSKLVGRVRPGTHEDGSPLTIPEYLDVLYHHATAARSHAAAKARQLERLRAAVDSAEPAPVRTSPTSLLDQKITAELDDDAATALAVRQSIAELTGGQ